MITILKRSIREIFMFLRLDLTRNLRYDRLSKLIIKKHLNSNSSCIDIGAHTGDFLRQFIKQSPYGKHFAFEPIPKYFDQLNKKYSKQATIFSYALSNQNGFTTFNYIRNAPSYSGLRERKYAISNPDIKLIDIEQRTLDSCIPKEIKIDLIKIDVEGAEYHVLEGAQEILATSKPLILFECGIGASDYYGTKPEMIFDLLARNKYQLFLLPDWLEGKQNINKEQFVKVYHSKKEFFFLGE